MIAQQTEPVQYGTIFHIMFYDYQEPKCRMKVCKD